MPTTTSLALLVACVTGGSHALLLAPARTTRAPAERDGVVTRRDVMAVLTSAATLAVPNFALAAEDGFETGPKGIRFQILVPGEGDPPKRAQQVYAKYTLWTGGFGEKKVDSNVGGIAPFNRPLPVIVGVGRVIPGWDIMLLQMKVGETRRIVVPPDVGYGSAGAGKDIPPNTTLYFEVQITSMDPVPSFNEKQLQWLQDNPLPEDWV